MCFFDFDSGCAQEIWLVTSINSQLLDIKVRDSISFGNNDKFKVIGIWNIELISKFMINNALLVKGMKYNLFSISQLCYN